MPVLNDDLTLEHRLVQESKAVYALIPYIPYARAWCDAIKKIKIKKKTTTGRFSGNEL